MESLPIVAFGAVSPLGDGLGPLCEALDAGRSGLSVGSPTVGDAWHPTGDVPFDLPALPAGLARHDSRCARLLARCLEQVSGAVEQVVRRVPPERIGVVVGTSASGNTDLERAHVPGGEFEYAYHDRQTFGVAAVVARQLLAVRGPSFVVSTACSSGAGAIASAARLIGAGVCDAVVAASVDALCGTTYHGFRNMGVMDERLCRPFDEGRDGLNLGEGASALVLCRAQRVPRIEGPRLFLAGCGLSADAHHMTAPDPTGGGATLAMERALADATVGPEEVGYVNLHGTGTPHNDLAEARGVHRVFGTAVPCSSTKGFTGHLLGAAGGVEAAISLLALERQRLPRNLHIREQDPEVAIPILRDDADAPGIRHALSNSFAFGGANAALLFGVQR